MKAYIELDFYVLDTFRLYSSTYIDMAYFVCCILDGKNSMRNDDTWKVPHRIV